MEFKVGDRVKLIGYDCYYYSALERHIGATGTIIKIEEDGEVCVVFDEDVGGHTLGGRCKDGHGHRIYKKDLELMSHQFKVGDRIQFKSWEEMEEEYSVDYDDDIVLGKSKYFYETDKELCGSYATIHEIEETEAGTRVYLVDFEIEDYLDNDDADDEFWIECIKPFNGKPSKDSKSDKQRNYSLSDEENRVLSGLYSYTYIARDSNGLIFAYINKPVKDIGGLQWYSKSLYKEIPRNLFKFIKWGDNPMEIEKLKGGK